MAQLLFRLGGVENVTKILTPEIRVSTVILDSSISVTVKIPK